MAVKPKRSLKEKKRIDPAEAYYLEYGTHNGGPPYEHLKAELFLRMINDIQWCHIWAEVKQDIMAAWIKKNPCSRPWGWWEYDAPRWKRKFEGCFWDGKLPEPRQRLGGTGDPAFEFLAYVPSFNFGLPTTWITKDDVDSYNGRAKDIQGDIIPSQYKEGDFQGRAIDPEDPPTFESEAAYLKRNDLLTAAELKHLEKHPQMMEPERIET